MSRDKELRLSDPVNSGVHMSSMPPDIRLYNSGQQVGRIILGDDGQLDFEGDATEAARVFLDVLGQYWRESAGGRQ